MGSTVSTRKKVLSSMGFVCESKKMNGVLDLLDEVAPGDRPILFHGETGCGKAPVSRYTHEKSGRTGKYVPQNCAAMPSTLLDAELFGHDKGAFTGAHRRRKGLFHAARGGTLFLDEIGEMDPAMQAKLLTVIEDGIYRGLGMAEDCKSTARVIASTNKGIETVGNGGVREDLWYRFTRIEVPPLRKRKEDIMPISSKVVSDLAAEFHGVAECSLSETAASALMEHNYPGNVRELMSTLYIAFLRAKRRVGNKCVEIDRDDIIFDKYSLHAEGMIPNDGGFPPWIVGLDFMKAQAADVFRVAKALNDNDYNFQAAGRALGVSGDAIRKGAVRKYFGTSDKRELRGMISPYF